MAKIFISDPYFEAQLPREDFNSYLPVVTYGFLNILFCNFYASSVNFKKPLSLPIDSIISICHSRVSPKDISQSHTITETHLIVQTVPRIKQMDENNQRFQPKPTSTKISQQQQNINTVKSRNVPIFICHRNSINRARFLRETIVCLNYFQFKSCGKTSCDLLVIFADRLNN